MTSNKLRLTILGVGLLSLIGCDQSKPELERTKTALIAVTAERDAVKNQLAEANAQNTQLQQQLSDLRAKATPPPEAATEAAAPAEPAAKTKPLRSARKPVNTEPAAETRPAPTPAEQRQIREIDKKANTGGGHF
jgi:hypothetical protein